MKYELALEKYEGPIDKLLELVEEKKLEITQISLAEVTANFLEFLKKLESENESHIIISDFLVIASKLILIKSKTLLPSLELTREEETEVKDLEERLKIYADFKEAKNILKKNWHILPLMLSREYLKSAVVVFYPPSALKATDLLATLKKLLNELESLLRPTQAVKNEIISLKAKIEEILRRLTDQPLTFSSLHRKGSRSEIIVFFLAILYLIKEQLIHIEQKSHFDEIEIFKLNKRSE